MQTTSTRGTDFTDISAAAAQLPASKAVELPGGGVVHVKRLSWLAFESAWTELASLLAAVANTPAEAQPGQLAQALSGAPGCLLRLCELCTDLDAAQLGALEYDWVLAIAAEALALNFVDSAGVRRFFCVMAQLPGAIQPG